MLFPSHRGFRLCGGDQRAFRSPFGNLRPPCCGWKFPQEIRCFLAFPISQGFASAEATKGLSGRPLETFGPMLRMEISTRNKMLPCFFRFAGFRLCGGDQRAFRSPFGNLRPPCCGWEFSQEMDCAKLSINSKKRARQVETPAWHAFILPLFLSHPAPVAQLPPCLPPRWWHDAVSASPATAAPAAAPAHR